MFRPQTIVPALILTIFSLCAAEALGQIDAEGIIKQRVDEIVPRSMEKLGIDLWLVFARENSLEPFLSAIGLHNTTARSAYLFYKTGDAFKKTAIAAGYDVSPIIESGLFDEVISYREEGIKPHLKKIVGEINPKVIAVNSSRDVTIADGLTHGMYLYLVETLGEEIAGRFVSSEELVISVLGTKLPQEIEALRRAVEVTQEAINATLSSEFIVAGKTTENDVRAEFTRRVKEIGCEVAFCSVVVGPTRGHAPSSDRVIQPGDLIRVDCGARCDGYCADIQRTAYVLKEGETAPPAEILKFWDVAKQANRAAFAAVKPGVRGVDVDTAGRKVITDAGFPDIPHGSGHAIGLRVHDVGPQLCPDWPERYGNSVFFRLEPNQVFTLEPILYVYYPAMGGTINIGLEENVVVTEDGAEYIGILQEELIVIRSR
jgi:Xaa-Pro dipeptidase